MRHVKIVDILDRWSSKWRHYMSNHKINGQSHACSSKTCIVSQLKYIVFINNNELTKSYKIIMHQMCLWFEWRNSSLVLEGMKFMATETFRCNHHQINKAYRILNSNDLQRSFQSIKVCIYVVNELSITASVSNKWQSILHPSNM